MGYRWKKKQGEPGANKQTVKRLHRGLIGHRWKQLKTGETNEEQVGGHKGEEANEAKPLQTRKERHYQSKTRSENKGRQKLIHKTEEDNDKQIQI